MNSGEAATKQATTYDELLYGILLAQMQRSHVAKLVTVGVAATVAFYNAPLAITASWIAFFTISQALRVLVVRRYLTRTDKSIAHRIRVDVMLMVLESVSIALCLVRFPWLALPERTVLTGLIVGLCAGSVTTSGADKRLFLAFILPLLIPLALLWTTFVGTPFWIGPVLGVLFVLLVVYLYGSSRAMDRILRESFAVRQERAALNRELKVALDSVQSARDVAEAASQAKTRFLASASHDLRQPIQTLSLFAAALAMRPLDDRTRQIANNINAALQDLTGELDALLDVSKLDAGIVQIQPSVFLLNLTVERIHNLFLAASQQKHVELAIACPPNAWTCTDRNHLERVVRNLVENSIKYTDAGSVRVEVIRDGDCYRLSVTDTGCGISAAEQGRIFEEFYQINNPERDRKRGLGLGLSIVKRLTTLLNVPLTLSSTPKVGTRIVLTLPIAKPDTRAAPVSQIDQNIGALHVLAIDDEESVRLGMKALLEGLGCTVSLGASTDDAVTEAQLKAPDILLTDLRLRGTDNGIETIRAVRELIPNLPSLIISGDSTPERMLEAQAIGIVVVHKPVSSTMLLAELAKLTAVGNY